MCGTNPSRVGPMWRLYIKINSSELRALRAMISLLYLGNLLVMGQIGLNTTRLATVHCTRQYHIFPFCNVSTWKHLSRSLECLKMKSWWKQELKFGTWASRDEFWRPKIQITSGRVQAKNVLYLYLWVHNFLLWK